MPFFYFHKENKENDTTENLSDTNKYIEESIRKVYDILIF